MLLAERDQERARADRAQAVADERSRMIDALREELVQVRKDKEAEIRSRSIRFTDVRERGQPWPVFALQRRVDGQWRDHSADYFRPHSQGLAVSLSEPGRCRLVAALSPWSLHFSGEADTSLPRRDGRHEVKIEAGRGRTAEVRVSTLGRNLAGAPVHLVSSLPGMPPAVVTADVEGRIWLDDVTVDAIALEVPGYAQVDVRLDATQQQVQLTPDDAER